VATTFLALPLAALASLSSRSPTALTTPLAVATTFWAWPVNVFASLVRLVDVTMIYSFGTQRCTGDVVPNLPAQ
jgi:hypothetical protein